jgi:starvation-inducible DNA-binding protein
MNRIGINNKQAKTLSQELNELLSDYQVFYMNVRGFHWNIKGQKFFELHLKFEELYNDLLLKIDEVAERILTLGQGPLHSYSDYLKKSSIKEVKNLSSVDKTINHILDGFEILIKKQRVLLKLSDEANDEGTNALMSDYLREQEKLVWMFSAFNA